MRDIAFFHEAINNKLITYFDRIGKADSRAFTLIYSKVYSASSCLIRSFLL